jgi:small subunit ribosomal protein S9
MTDETPRDDEQTPEQAPPAEQEAAAEEAAAQSVPAEAEGEAPTYDPAVEPMGNQGNFPEGGPEVDIEARVEGELIEADDVDVVDELPTPRVKPEIPGADLEVDIVAEGDDPLARAEAEEAAAAAAAQAEEAEEDRPIAAAAINLAADARYRATGKRKTSVARVTLKPGTGVYTINGKVLEDFFPRPALQRNIRQPLEAVGYEERMDVVARMHGGGVSAQAGALRHGISRALLEADPNLRGELKRRGFLTRDPRVKERKKAGLKKARKRPQFSKR